MSKILVVGAGAIGAFYGSRLARSAAAQVSCICRSNYEVVHSKGFTIHSPTFGTYQWKPAQVFRDSDEAHKHNKYWDYILVATKVLPEIADESLKVRNLVKKDTTIVLIQNGIGIEEPYHKRYPNAGILSAVTITSAAQPEHGLIQHNKYTRIDLAPYPEDNAQLVEKSRHLCELFAQGGVPDASTCSSENMQLLRWHKVAINAAFNPSSVLAGGSPVSEMANDPYIRQHLKDVIEEVFAVARGVTGKTFPRQFASAEQIVQGSRTNPGVPSMLMDWDGRKPMELEVILGNVIKQAQAVGATTPRTSTMYALLRTAQARRGFGIPPRL